MSDFDLTFFTSHTGFFKMFPVFNGGFGFRYLHCFLNRNWVVRQAILKASQTTFLGDVIQMLLHLLVVSLDCLPSQYTEKQELYLLPVSDEHQQSP